jgi:pectate lyase
VRTRIEAELLVENNYFENVKNPWEQYVDRCSGTQGKLKASGNNIGFMDTSYNVTWYVSTGSSDGQSYLIPGTDVVFTPPYSYSFDSASLLKVLLQLEQVLVNYN